MNDWPFSSREMTVVHVRFVIACKAALARLDRERRPGGKQSFSMKGSRALDRAFDALKGRTSR